MKVDLEHLEALQNQNAVKTGKSGDAGDFGAVLTQEVSRSSGQGAASADIYAAQMMYGPAQILAIEQMQAIGQDPDSENDLMNAFENVLGKWENYSDYIKGAGGSNDLRQAFGILETISSDVNTLKTRAADMGPLPGQLQGVLDELDAMALTERFKFNRGDYL